VDFSIERLFGLLATQSDTEDMSSFYMTLPSNSSMDVFPDNTLAEYATKLPQNFDMQGEWEVGMSEIQFPTSWYNVSRQDARLFLKVTPYGQSSREVNISPPAGLYDTPEILVKEINSLIAAAKIDIKTIRFKYNNISKKISCEAHNLGEHLNTIAETTFIMTEHLAEMLGFNWERGKEFIASAHRESASDVDYSEQLPMGEYQRKQFDILAQYPDKADFVEVCPFNKILEIDESNEIDSYTAENVCDLNRGFFSLFVYCDVVEPVVVGDVLVPLLRTVNITAKEGIMVSRIFETVQYVPVHRKQFDTIEIHIRDDTGRRIPFQRGKVIVTLHFRRKLPF